MKNEWVRGFVWVSCLLLASTTRAETLVQSSAFVSAVENHRGCQDRPAPGVGFDCGGLVEYDYFEYSDLADDGSIASVDGWFGTISPPFVLTSVSARAQTDPWRNRVEAHAFATHYGFENAAPGVGFQRVDSAADASAASFWSAPLTITGGTGGGVAVLQLRMTGTLAVDQPDDVPAAAAELNYRFYTGPLLGEDEVEPLFTLTESGAFDEVLSIPIAFVYGVELQANSLFTVYIHASGGYPFLSDGGPGNEQTGYSDAFGAPYTSDVDADFFSTLAVERLILPAGAAAVGEGGGILPFEVVVPEPAGAVLLLAALGTFVGARRRRALAR